MPQVHYPFIDVAVHPAVRTRFAAGDAVVLFSRDMKDVLWANGAGARQFGHREIYDLIDSGPEAGSVSFRQLSAAAAQLAVVGDRRGFVMRTTSGFRSAAVQADVSLIAVGRDECVMFSAPAGTGQERLASLLSGFDDPDTHMAVLDGDGVVLVASDGFAQIGVMQDTARALIVAASRSTDGLVKRPIPSGSGYLPAAIGRLADELYLLFCVETSIGRMDAPEEREAHAAPMAAVAQSGPVEDSPAEVAETIEVAAVVEQSDAGDMDPAPDGVEDDDLAAAEEEAFQADIADLALLDGARAEDIEAASVETDDAAVETIPETDQPTERHADIAEASSEDDHAVLEPSIALAELAGDGVETSDRLMDAPAAFVEADATKTAAEGAIWVDEPAHAEETDALERVEASAEPATDTDVDDVEGQAEIGRAHV